MAYKMRKDPKGHALKPGESCRKDGRYSYSWTNSRGERKFIYATDLLELRKKEKKLIYDLEDGIEPETAEKVTVNQLWDKYIGQKYDLKDTTRANYMYCYDKFVRGSFGKMKLAKVKYSDVKAYYHSLMTERGLKANTVDNVHCLLHPTFQLAIRDGLLRVNPTDEVMKEIKRSKEWEKPKRMALTIPQQKALVNYISGDSEFAGWYPIVTVLLGTGMRIGECLGLRWSDLDFDGRMITVSHSLAHKSNQERKTVYSIQTPKTKAGIRTIPMISEVRDAFVMEYEIQKCIGFCRQEIDGYSGFVFSSSDGHVYSPEAINQALYRIRDSYNEEEKVLAKKEKREPILLPQFSCHILRHTFCTRLCENESNIKVIQSVMGHRDISTTMDIYADCTDDKKQEVLNNLDGKIIIK